MSAPIDILNVLEGEPGRVVVLSGELTPGKTVVAETHCEITLHSEEAIIACIDALKQSDVQLKLRPAAKVLYEWNKVFREGNKIIFGVVWYDEAFFEARKDAFKSAQHVSIFERFGISTADFKIEHELAKPRP